MMNSSAIILLLILMLAFSVTINFIQADELKRARKLCSFFCHKALVAKYCVPHVPKAEVLAEIDDARDFIDLIESQNWNYPKE